MTVSHGVNLIRSSGDSPLDEKQAKGVRLRALIAELLQSDDFQTRLEECLDLPARRVINPLLSFLYSADERVKWRAVTVVGCVMARMADADMESARIVMRRLMWSLNDESGGIGWGAPEAMGEIMASHHKIAEEYYRILISYIREDGNDLENDLLKRGVLWGLGRLASVRPHLVKDSAEHLLSYLESRDPILRGLATWVMGFLHPIEFRRHLEHLLGDQARVQIYQNGALNHFRICELAALALKSAA